jgi:hypothetical protein
MNDDLSEEAKMVLAFIRDHPGCQSHQIRNEIRFDEKRFNDALVELLRKKLIIPGEDSAEFIGLAIL